MTTDERETRIEALRAEVQRLLELSSWTYREPRMLVEAQAAMCELVAPSEAVEAVSVGLEVRGYDTGERYVDLTVEATVYVPPRGDAVMVPVALSVYVQDGEDGEDCVDMLSFSELQQISWDAVDRAASRAERDGVICAGCGCRSSLCECTGPCEHCGSTGPWDHAPRGDWRCRACGQDSPDSRIDATVTTIGRAA